MRLYVLLPFSVLLLLGCGSPTPTPHINELLSTPSAPVVEESVSNWFNATISPDGWPTATPVPPTATPVPIRWRWYESATYGYKFKVPTDWELLEDTHSYKTFRSPDRKASLLVEAVDLYDSAYDTVTMLLDVSMYESAEFEVIRRSPYEIGLDFVASTTYLARPTNRTCLERNTALIQLVKGKTYSMRLGVCDNVADVYEPLLEEIRQTFDLSMAEEALAEP